MATPAEVLAASAKPISGNSSTSMASLAASAAIYARTSPIKPQDDRHQIAKPWQIEAYRHIHICGEARYSAALFSAIAGRAEIGVSQPQSLRHKATWVTEGPEVDVINELAPTVRERTKLIRDYMLHRTIAGECYLIARNRQPTDPGYIAPPDNPTTGEPYESWDAYRAARGIEIDLFDEDFDTDDDDGADPNEPIWEIVAVTELQKVGKLWRVRHDNDNWIDLDSGDPVIRLWNPDPERRREAWSPFRSLLPTLREIEWLTMHIFTQVRSRLMSAGVWFLPDNLTFPEPPPDAVEGGAEAIAAMNEAERFMTSLAVASMKMLDPEDVSFPSIVLAEAAALEYVDQSKLIKFWSEIDDAAMKLRTDAVRRFALGMDMPPGKTIDPIAIAGASTGSGGQNHWGKWAEQEQVISDHIEPALDDFVGSLTHSVLRRAVDGTRLVVAYDTASLRLRQDRSKEAMEWYDRGVLKAEVALREGGFDPDNDMMDESEKKIWILTQLVKGSPSPEQMQAAFAVLTGAELPVKPPEITPDSPAKGVAGPNLPPSLDDHPYEGPPRGQKDHSPAPFSALGASCEALVLRALEKNGNRLLNDGKRGRDKDRATPPHLAHLTASLSRPASEADFDFSMAPYTLDGVSPRIQEALVAELATFCADLTNNGQPYTREALAEAVGVL